MNIEKVNKRFPATLTLEEPTFLNNKKIDAELYAYLQSKSRVENKQTIVYKYDLDTQKQIGNLLGFTSPKTYRAHIKVLEETGYLVPLSNEQGWILPEAENYFLFIPLKTLQFLRDVFKDQVIKLYIYLGQRWKCNNGQPFEFTYVELGAHIGIEVANRSRGYETIRNMIKTLVNNGLIEVSDEYFVGNGKSRRSLLKWTTGVKG